MSILAEFDPHANDLGRSSKSDFQDTDRILNRTCCSVKAGKSNHVRTLAGSSLRPHDQ